MIGRTSQFSYTPVSTITTLAPSHHHHRHLIISLFLPQDPTPLSRPQHNTERNTKSPAPCEPTATAPDSDITSPTTTYSNT